MGFHPMPHLRVITLKNPNRCGDEVGPQGPSFFYPKLGREEMETSYIMTATPGKDPRDTGDRPEKGRQT